MSSAFGLLCVPSRPARRPDSGRVAVAGGGDVGDTITCAVAQALRWVPCRPAACCEPVRGAVFHRACDRVAALSYTPSDSFNGPAES